MDNFHSHSAIDSARNFLKISDQFKLGHLTTESRHPLTMNLSEVLKKNISDGVQLLLDVDLLMLKKVFSFEKNLLQLKNSIEATLKSNRKVFLCGCGATGRLSLAIETLWHQAFPNHSQSVISFMAGGDVALIKSLESFEDHPEYGEKQLLELGFCDGDLLLAITEGGETPFVIGACNTAQKISKNAPYFLYCNPDQDLKKINRSNDIIKNNKIIKINLTIGPMAISGSTRMQASTVLMFAAGFCLINYNLGEQDFFAKFSKTINDLLKIDLKGLDNLIGEEERIYRAKEFIIYQTPKELALPILTDTTERSPTFSLPAFENYHDQNKINSLCYLSVTNTSNSITAWESILFREPRCLNWEDCEDKASLFRLQGFDVSENILKIRDGVNHLFSISNVSEGIKFNLNGKIFILKDFSNDLLTKNLMLKMTLNILSTSIMGLMLRYQGNIMTWVKPTNNKLIDRSARYIQHLLKDKNIEKSYEEIVVEIFKNLDSVSDSEPIVLKVFDILKN